MIKPALAAALAVLFAAEWLLPGPAAPPARQPPAIPATTADTGADAAIAQWGATILARPLFNQDRRPVQPAAPDTTEPLPRLSAIIVVGGSRRAIFAASGEKPQTVAEGGAIGAYRIKTVLPDKVDLIGPNGPVTLRPQFMTSD
jgi:general secretion pathway protein N